MAQENTGMLGKWKSLRVDNYDAYLAALGMNYIQRKIAQKATTYIDISKEGDEWVWRLTVLVFSEVTRFVVGKEFDAQLEPSKKKIKKMVTFKDGQMIWTMHVDPPMTSVYYMEGDNILISEDTVGDVEMKATYQRIE